MAASQRRPKVGEIGGKPANVAESGQKLHKWANDQNGQNEVNADAAAFAVDSVI